MGILPTGWIVVATACACTLIDFFSPLGLALTEERGLDGGNTPWGET